MMPVCFTDDGWFNINGGITAIEVETELINTVQKLNNSYTPIERRFLRKFEEANYIFDENIIKIKSSSDTLDDAGSPAFVGFNQKEFDIELSVKVKVLDGEAGVVFYMDEEHYYALSIQNNQAKLTLKIGDIKHEKASCPVTGNEAVLKIKADAINYEFFCDNKLLGTARTRYLSSEVAGGFTGVVIGLFSQNGVNGGFNEFSELQLPISR
jgi:alpha-N-arabinofuranosidase